MREIKFRAWSLERNSMIYPDNNGWYDGVFRHENGHLQTVQLATVVKDKRLVALQYTGLKDKNGREIYEGDVVKGHYYAYGKARRFIGEVKFIGVAFKVVGVKQYRGMHQELDRLYATIGNIYENPELLEETK